MNFRFYWSLFLRRLPVMMALFLVCSAIAVVAALKLPPTYTTTARLLVEAPQISDNLIRSTVQTDAARQLEVIEQQLLTRSNMIDIANTFRVFEDITSMTPDKVNEEMRKQTRIRRTGGRGAATFMTISFEARDPRIAAQVVTEYVTLALQANSRARRSQAEGTLDFFEQETERLSKNLDQQSIKIIDFKNANARALPDDLQYRLGRQALLQERLSRLERERAGLTAQRSEIVAIFQATGQVDVEQDVQLTQEARQLNELEAELSDLLSVYSETNPKVFILKGRVDKLRSVVAAQAGATDIDQQGTKEATLLDVTMAELESRSTALDIDVNSTTEELNILADSIAATSGNAIMLQALEREYDNIQASYDEVVSDLNAARMGERIETSAKGERVTVIEGATVPQVPSGPNRKSIAALGIGAGLGLAAGFFVLLEILNRTIRRPSELKSRFEVIPLANIPYMETPSEKFRRRAVLVAAFLAVLTGVPAALWYIDTNYMPLDILASKVINRIGLS